MSRIRTLWQPPRTVVSSSVGAKSSVDMLAQAMDDKVGRRTANAAERHVALNPEAAADLYVVFTVAMDGRGRYAIRRADRDIPAVRRDTGASGTEGWASAPLVAIAPTGAPKTVTAPPVGLTDQCSPSADLPPGGEAPRAEQLAERRARHPDATVRSVHGPTIDCTVDRMAPGAEPPPARRRSTTPPGQRRAFSRSPAPASTDTCAAGARRGRGRKPKEPGVPHRPSSVRNTGFRRCSSVREGGLEPPRPEGH